MNFEEALAYMGGLLRFGWKLGNDRFMELCARLGNPQDQYGIIHIAGTKGKGSTTALAAAVLREAGYTVGGYFSPYVYDPCERVQVNGEMIPRADFARLVTQIRPHIEAIAQTDLGQTTEFELKTALGFLYFAERGVDFACIEVGIGGRLDATNVVKPNVTVITNIGLDHTQVLGDTHAQIAAEKAGIIKCGVPCFTAVDHPDALAVIQQTAESRRAPLILVQPGPTSTPIGDATHVYWALIAPNAEGEKGRRGEGETKQAGKREEGRGKRSQAEQSQIDNRQSTIDNRQHPIPHISPVTIATPEHLYAGMDMRMGGVYQRANAACAVAAVERLLEDRGISLSSEAVRRALATTALPGRLEIARLPGGPLVVLDGAHNDMAAQALAGPVDALRVQHQIRRLLLVVGMVGGHDPDGVLAVFAPKADRVYACRPNWKRAQPAEEVASVACRFTPHVVVIPSVPDAVRAALAEAGSDDMVLITGSFYTVGEARL